MKRRVFLREFDEWRKFKKQTRTSDELTAAWGDFEIGYRFHESKNTWKTGHLSVIQRLVGKSHICGVNGLAGLIPQGVFSRLFGNPFVCPDRGGRRKMNNVCIR